MTIELQKLNQSDLDGFAGVEDPEAARKGEFQLGESEVILITEPETCQVHGCDDAGELFSYGIFFDNEVARRNFLLYATTVLALVDNGDIHVPEDFVTEAGMEQLV